MAASFNRKIKILRIGRIEQADNDPVCWMPVDRTDIEMRVALYHFFLVGFAKRRFPFFLVIIAPVSIGLAHFPICARHRVPLTVRIIAHKFVREFVGYLFELLRWAGMKQHRLIKIGQLLLCPLGGVRLNNQPLYFARFE